MALSGLGLSAQDARFRSQVAGVRVDALVTDGRRPVTGLTAANFELRDNGVLQTITDVHHETLPLNVVCAFDVSGSVAGVPLGHLKEGLRGVISALGRDDRAALLTFAERIELHSALTGRSGAAARARRRRRPPAAPRRSSMPSLRRWRCAKPMRAARCSSSSATAATRPAG